MKTVAHCATVYILPSKPTPLREALAALRSGNSPDGEHTAHGRYASAGVAYDPPSIRMNIRLAPDNHVDSCRTSFGQDR